MLRMAALEAGPAQGRTPTVSDLSDHSHKLFTEFKLTYPYFLSTPNGDHVCVNVATWTYTFNLLENS